MDRRAFIQATMATAVASVVGCTGDDDGVAAGPNDPSSSADEDRVFPQGVASGDPGPDHVLLWTRVEPADPGLDVSVRWFVAADEAFNDVVASGQTDARADADHTVRLRLTDLEPDTVYYYRFEAQGVTTRNGRTRTAPAADADRPVRFAIASCQEFVGRWYHAWRVLAERDDDIDFVVFLGDYIYEWIGDPRFQPAQTERRLTLPDGLSLDGSDTNLAALTLADYRALYKQYRSDPDLKEAHRRYPFIIMWDDHEFVNDCWQDVANEFDGERGEERDTTRRESATRAWFEFLPVDVPYGPAAGFPHDIVTYRRARWGRHVDLLLTDPRYYRDDHLVPESEAEPAVGKFTPNSILGSRIFAIKEGFDELEAAAQPTMFGTTQRQWLIDEIRASDATWKVWASALMVAQLSLDLREEEELPPLVRNHFYFKPDQWDGFRSERRSILEAVADIDDVVVVSGDLHGNYAAELRPDFDAPETPATAVEFTVTGISSISLQEQVDKFTVDDPRLEPLGLDAVTPRFDEVIASSGPHFRYINSSAYGYAVVQADGAGMLVRFVEIASVTSPEFDGAVQTVEMTVERGSRELRRV